MRFGALDIPASVLDALEEDRLVVFAGAGVSSPPPSSLPTFEELANQIGTGAKPREEKAIDRYLGRLERADGLGRPRIYCRPSPGRPSFITAWWAEGCDGIRS